MNITFFVFVLLLNYFICKFIHFCYNTGLNLQNNVQVANGSDVKINISSLTSDATVKCVLAPDGSWGREEVVICSAKPPENCTNPSLRYKHRARFVDTSTLEIQDVRPDESGIYKCETRTSTASKIIIYGVIIVGKLSFIICSFRTTYKKQRNTAL